MAKNILKSIRLSNEINKYIEEFEGKGFNEKFENIIIYAMKTEIDRKKRLDEIINLIESRSQELEQINKKLTVARNETRKYKQIMSVLNLNF